jgi:hypothetical protein
VRGGAQIGQVARARELAPHALAGRAGGPESLQASH